MLETAQATAIRDIRFNRIPANIRARWRLVRDVVSGDESLRTDEEYLPFINKHDTSLANQYRNNAYRKRAVWFPATGFTLEGLTGLAFRNDPTQEIEGTKLEPLLTNVDGAGVSLYQQSQASLANVLQVGRHGLLTDYNAKDKQAIILPYVAESIINWRYSVKDGRAILSRIVLYEEVEQDDGEWAVVTVPQWRELFLGEDGFCYCRLWQLQPSLQAPTTVQGVMLVNQIDSAGTATNILEIRSAGQRFDFIPFTFIGSRNNDWNIDPQPLYGLAALNLAHFRNSADHEDSVFYCGQAQAWASGLTEEWRDHLENPKDEQGNPTGATFYVGSRMLLMLPEKGQFGFAQPDPNTLVKDAMEQKEAQMVKVGARIIEGVAPGGRTATEDENDKEATTSVLSMCVANVNEAYQRALWFAAQFMDMGKEYDTADAYKINQEFVRAAADSTVVDSLVKSWQSGLIAKDDVRAYMRRVGLIATERDDVEIEADIEKDPPPLGTMGLDGAPPASGKTVPPTKPGAKKPAAPSRS